MGKAFEIVKVRNGYIIFDTKFSDSKPHLSDTWVFCKLEDALKFLDEKLNDRVQFHVEGKEISKEETGDAIRKHFYPDAQ